MDTHILPFLKVAAVDSEDLNILSAHLQDAIIPLHSMHYNEDTGTFSGLCNRFCWEHDDHYFEGKQLFHRVHSGLTFHGVSEVHHRGFDPHGDERTLNLLTVKTQAGHNGTTHIHLVFSGQSEIRLSVNSIKCLLGDLHHPWPTEKKPSHKASED